MPPAMEVWGPDHWMDREFPEATLSRGVREDFSEEVASELRKPGEWMS